MSVALPVYGLAAGFDLHSRRVPNWAWVVATGAAVWNGVTVKSAVSAIGVFCVGWIVWKVGEMGGADVKALAVLPLVLPELWYIACTVAYLLAGGVLAGPNREEVPFLVPMFGGVVAAMTVPYLYS